jgi:large subunit ribosomal protein L9
VEVILLEEVSGLGRRGATVKVASGYARNFLLPRRLAVPAGTTTANQLKTLTSALETRDSKLRQDAEALASRLHGARVTITARVSEEGLLYGSVTGGDVADELAKQGFEIDKRQVQLDEHLKQAGTYEVPVRLFGGVNAQVTVEVVPQ